MISSRLCPRPAAGGSRAAAEGESAAGPSPSSRERGRCPAGARSRGGRGWAQGEGGRGDRAGGGGGGGTPEQGRGRRGENDALRGEGPARHDTARHAPARTTSWHAKPSSTVDCRAGVGRMGPVGGPGVVLECVSVRCVAKAVPSPYHPKSPGPGTQDPTARRARTLRRAARARWAAAVPGSGPRPRSGSRIFPGETCCISQKSPTASANKK